MLTDTERKSAHAESLVSKTRSIGKQVFLNSLLMLSSLVFILLVSEGVFFVLNKLYPVEQLVVGEMNGEPNQERKDFFQYHSVYGYAGLPNVQKEFVGKMITHNGKGLRGRELPYKKPDGVKRAVFLGDSQTWGWAVGDDETIPVYFEQAMNQQTDGPRYETVNLGATGYGPGQSYLRLISEGLRYEPDLVVFTYFAENDVSEASSYDVWGVEKPYFFEKPDGKLCVSNVPPRRASGWPTDNIGFIMREKFKLDIPVLSIGGLSFDLAKTNIATYFKSRSLNKSIVGLWGADDSDPLAAIDKYIGCRQQKPAQRLADFRQQQELMMKLIVQIRDTAEAAGAQFIVIAKPLEDDYINNRVSASHHYVLGELMKNNIKFVELMAEAKVHQMTREQMFLAFGHLTPEANRLAANGVVRFLDPANRLSFR